MKKKIVYVSGEDFFDVDFPILKELNKSFDLLWIPILREKSWFSLEEIESFCIEYGIPNSPIVQKFKYKDPRMIILYIRLLNRIRSENSDVIYFEYFGVPFLHLFTPFYFNSNKLVFAIHDVKQHYKMDYGKLKTIYFDYILNKFKNFHVFSHSQLKLFLEKYNDKNVFVGNLYLKDFGESSIIKKETKGKINFLFFGIIRNNKGIDVIIDAFNEISKVRKDFTVTIAGYTKDWSQYDLLIKDNSIYNLIIRKIENREIPDLFTNADYILLPYLDVTQSGVLLTAYNYNLPAVASNFPGFQEYISDGENGFLIEPTVESLKDKIEFILNQEESDLVKIKNNLKDFVAINIDLKLIINQYTRFFNKL